MTLSEFYDISTEYIPQTMSVKNGFVAYLFTKVKEQLQAGKVPALDIGTNISKLNMGLAGQVQDMFAIPSFFEGSKYSCLRDELIAYRASQYGVELKDLTNNGRNVLLADYLMKTCICYVEVYKGNIPTKMFATRNMNIMHMLATLDADDPAYENVRMPLTKGANDLGLMLKKTAVNTRPMTTSELMNGTLPHIKIESKKTGYSISIPRTQLDIAGGNIRIVPVFFNYAILEVLYPLMQNNIMHITYLKDNMVERKIYTTLNHALLTKVFEGDSARATEVLAHSNSRHLNRGYITVPELLLPKYDETGCRALSMRITGYEVVPADTFTNPFLNINIDGVATVFKYYVDTYKNNINMLRIVQQLIDTKFGELRGVTDETALEAYMARLNTKGNLEIVNDLNFWIETQTTIDKTQVSRALHLCMIENPMLFPRYTGEYVSSSATSTDKFADMWG